jgi:archaetidylinositol phosphate synthase
MPELNDIRNHKRTNDILLGPLERPALQWLAVHMPAWMTPDGCTFIGLIGALTVMAGYILTKLHPAFLWLASAGFVINWFGDSLDGTLARVRNQQRPRYGYYVDHVVDLAGLLFLVGGLALSGFMSPLVALGLLVAYDMVTAEVFLATHAGGVFRMAFLGFGPTELRLVLAAGALWLLRSPWVDLGGLGTWRLFDVGGVVAIAGLAAAFVVSAVRNGRALFRAEPLRP